MGIIAHSHPSWCDPRLCVTHEDAVDHSGPPVLRTVADNAVTIGRVRRDPILTSGDTLVGADEIRIHTEDLESLDGTGRLITTELYLSLAEARDLNAVLAAALDAVTAEYRVSTR